MRVNILFSNKGDYLFRYIISEYLNQSCNRKIVIKLQDMVDLHMYRTQEMAYRELKQFTESLHDYSRFGYKVKGFSIAMCIFENYCFSYSNSNYIAAFTLNREFQHHVDMFIQCVSNNLKQIKKGGVNEQSNFNGKTNERP